LLGPPKPRCIDQPIAVSLEDLVSPSNFYRHLEARLDLSFLADWTQDQYADRERPSIDPVVFFKLLLVMFIEGIRSERQLIETASLNMAHRWYLGYAGDRGLFQRPEPKGDRPVARLFAGDRRHLLRSMYTYGRAWTSPGAGN
jgi:hypothetical protein